MWKGIITLPNLPNEKPIFLENISTKNDAWEEVLFKHDNGRGTNNKKSSLKNKDFVIFETIWPFYKTYISTT